MKTVTENFLMSISDRLSGRTDCKQTEYVVRISNSGITMEPTVNIYPNRYYRKDTDKRTVLQYALQRLTSYQIKHKLVPGTYVYRLSAAKKSRKWMRVDGEV